jgi:zinc/manganese transport system substrate-binding protein
MVSPGRLGGIAILVLSLLAACSGPNAGTTDPAAETSQVGADSGAAGEKLPVVATYSILGDMVAQVGGDQIDLTVLVGPGGDAHTFEPTPEDGRSLADTKVVFENGLAFEPWLNDLFAAAGSTASRVAVSEGVTPLAAPEVHEQEGEEHAEDEFDPHIWHDVNNALIMVENIRDGLAAADPANAEIYQANAERYSATLKELDSFVQEQVATLPAERRKLITSHDTFGYFAKRYGFVIVGTALGASTEAADPSAADIAALVDQIKAVGVPTIFAENVSNPQLMETIASEAGVKLGPPLYTDALGEVGSSGATYVQMIRFNVTTIVGALK